MEQNEKYTGVITRADAKGKILDFRDSLIPANQEDFPMMHGIGGQKHAPRSGIKATITDYSAGTGQSSVFVTANLPPHIFGVMAAVCEKEFGTATIHTGKGFWSILSGTAAVSADIRARLSDIMKAGLEGLRGVMQPEKKTEHFTEAGKTMATAVKAGGVGGGNTVCELPVHATWKYHQERVNAYKLDENGLCAVSIVDVFHNGYRENKKAGTWDEAMSPWYVKISNFKAKPATQENGTTKYVGSTVTDKKEAFITVSDEDMYRCCRRVDSYIDAWEKAVCLPVIKAGLKEREELRKAAANR